MVLRRNVLHSAKIRDMSVSSATTIDQILASEQVPSLPEVALRIIEIAQQEEPDTRELIQAVRTDPAIAGRIL